ncbi:MAG: tripartite tricarboxylate transporter substrate-binding protein [Proteobacteria bacterium]|nr:tripartite tricarboxylate transporter substrate-binding protein [Pseudomonadota bacterium]
MHRITFAASAAIAACITAAPAAADAVADFYKDRTVDMMVAAPPGGGFTAYARTIAKHIVKYIPGHPNMVVKNMPGSGGRKSVAYLYNVAPRNGAVILGAQPGTLVEPVLGQKSNAKFDALKFNYIGSASGFTTLCLVRAGGPVKSFAELQKTQAVFGGDNLGSTTFDHAQLMRNLAGANIKLIKGYRGTKNLVLAIEQGEIDGFCGYAWASLMSGAPHLVEQKKVKVLVQFGLAPHAEMTRRGIPQVWGFIKDEKKRKAMELFANVQVFGRPYIAPPSIPRDRLAALQKAFLDTMKDPAFVAEIKKRRLVLYPTSGPRVRALVAAIYNAPADVQKMARWALAH